jgi:deoxyribonuclease-4
MFYIGSHTSIAGGLENAAIAAHDIGANAFAMFTKNQRQWSVPPLEEEACTLFKKTIADLGFTPNAILPHDSYLINLGNPDEEKRTKATDAFIRELQRCEQLGLDRLNFHPGAHLGLISVPEELRLIARSIDRAVENVEGVTAVIETTAGQGSNVGSRFEEIRDIIAESRHPERIGVCIDTCHIFAGGYELRTKEGFDRTFSSFSSTIGFDRLMGMHLNDAKSEFDSHVDRHASIGDGNIGKEPFTWIMQDKRFSDIPLILETPDPSRWPEEIIFLRNASHEA